MNGDAEFGSVVEWNLPDRGNITLNKYNNVRTFNSENKELENGM
jgi:hypothetical protein